MILFLGLVALLAVVVSLLLSPIETLGWWAGWYGQGLEHPGEVEVESETEVRDRADAQLFVLYLDGIANVGRYHYQDVQAYLDGLSQALPDAVVLGNVMPYSVRDVALVSPRRPLANWWRRMFLKKLRRERSPLSFSINIRNLYQVLVAADPRYGRIFGRGEAQLILAALVKEGYRPGSGVPITVIGYSGGVQVGLAAAPFLRRALNAPLSMISLAGVMASEAGLDYLDMMYHLESSTDRIPLWGKILFPGRWPIMRRSHWNRMLDSGRLRFVNMGPMRHNGPGSYLDDDTVKYDVSNLVRTTHVTVDLLREITARLEGTYEEPARAVEGAA